MKLGIERFDRTSRKRERLILLPKRAWTLGQPYLIVMMIGIATQHYSCHLGIWKIKTSNRVVILEEYNDHKCQKIV